MRTALPAPAFLARARRRPRENPTSFADTFMSATRKLGLDCGEALNQAAACQPRARRLYETKPEYRADLRARWRRALADVVRARKDPNAFVEYILRGAKPSKRSAWHNHFAKSQPNRLVLAPAGAGMSGQLSAWRTKLDALWLARHLAENPGARVSIVSASERGADQFIEATKRSWTDIYRAQPTIEQRIADVSDGMLRIVANQRG